MKRQNSLKDGVVLDVGGESWVLSSIFFYIEHGLGVETLSQKWICTCFIIASE